MFNFMKKRRFLLLLLTVLWMSVPYAVSGLEKLPAEDFKIVGYYSGDLFYESVEKLQTDKMTHIMYAFLIPNEDGTVKPLSKPQQLTEVTEKAHRDGCKVYISLGGWSYEGVPLSGTFKKVAADDSLRAKLIESVVNFVNDNNLDGVEIDWEYPDSSTIGDYEKLVTELAKSLNAEGKQLTAAVNGAWSATAGPEVSQLMTDKCLNSFEFINVMGYDMNNGEHSPLWFASTSVSYWLNRGVPSEKIVLGLPLYARPSWMQYRHLVQQDTANAYRDYAATEPLESYYNGINTLREKTFIALRTAGGVMLFDINEDVDWRDSQIGKYSVVSDIRETVESVKSFTNQDLNKYVSVVLDNRLLTFEKESGMGFPFLDENYRTMVPMRKLLETIGADITWDNSSKTVTAVKQQPATNEYPLGKQTVVKVSIGDNFITVNGERVDMDTEAVIKEGRTYLPVRAVLTAFGYDLSWSDGGKTVYIVSL